MCSKTQHTILVYSFVCGNMANLVGVVWFSPRYMSLLMTNLGRPYVLPWNIIYFPYTHTHTQKKIESSQERPFAQWDQSFFKLFAPLLLRKKNYSLCELPSSLSCCEPLHLLLINLSCSFSFSLAFYVHRHQHTHTHVYAYFFSHIKYAHTYHICTYTCMYNIFVDTLLRKLLLPCKS